MGDCGSLEVFLLLEREVVFVMGRVCRVGEGGFV
jgi:hypothetical protein